MYIYQDNYTHTHTRIYSHIVFWSYLFVVACMSTCNVHKYLSFKWYIMWNQSQCKISTVTIRQLYLYSNNSNFQMNHLLKFESNGIERVWFRIKLGNLFQTLPYYSPTTEVLNYSGFSSVVMRFWTSLFWTFGKVTVDTCLCTVREVRTIQRK